MFSINLVTLDSYQSIPIPELDVTFSNFRGNEIKQVPVIRIFGSTISGIKTCVHIHGVFPYLYIPCIVNNNTDSFMYKLAAAIDSAINVSLGSAVSNTQHIYKIQQVSGIPLYGYHEKEHLFFKIYFYNPVMIKRAADLLQNGTILNQSLQPHEAHIPFILQFMIDYNLYGMSLINLKNVKFRQCIHTKSKENFQNESLLNLFDSQNFLPASILNQSICKLEVDAQAYEILNKQEIHNGIDLNPGIATIWNEEKYRRKAKCLQSVESQLLYTNIEDRIYDLTENDIYQEKRLIERLKSASQINENVTPLISKTSNYPLEVENEDNSFGALRVSNHFKSSELNKQNKNETSLNNDLLEFEKSVINESLHQDKTIENSILDSEDMYLVEILADLVEETEENKIVDNDSMLGSQFSMLNDQIKEDNEDDEIEDLNITSLDLDSLSSWNSIITENETKENEDYKKTDCKTEHNTESTSLMDFPQYDGSNDMILKCEKQLSNTNTEEKLIDLEKKDNALRTDIKTQVICKNNKDVRKRLSFVNTNIEEISPLKDNTDKYCFNKLSLREKILNDTDKSNDSAISFIMNSIDNKNSIQSDMKEDEKVNYKHDLPSTSKTNVHLYVDNVSNKISLMNRNTDEGNIYNMTYTQYLNRKLEFELNTSNITSLESTSGVIKTKLIIITTKFNPPSKERIINSMKTYNILTSKYSIPFFSNKVDFIKFKQGGNLSNSIYNITPFKCSLDRITGINLWRRVKINEFYPSGSSIKSCNIKKVLAGFNVLIIHSIIQPPTLKNVKIWLQTKKYLLKKNSLQKGIKDNIDILKNAKEDDIFRKTPTDNHSQYSNNLEYSNRCNSFNFSLRKILENPLLYKNNDTQHPGISCGQIEYSLKEYSGGIENENVQNAKGLTVHQYLTILAVEIHIITRDKLLPDPDHDPIEGIFYAIYNDVPLSQKIEQIEHGAILVNSSIQNSKVKDIHSTSTCITSYVSSEEDLLNSLIILVRHCDPDILIGWEIESLSWGYIFHRASVIGLHDFTQQISRILNTVPTSKKQISDKNNFNDVKIPGRIILDVWRIMRHEVALLSYTFENVMYNVMHERISCPTFKILTAWWNCKNVTIQWRIVTHYIIRVVGTLRILIHLDIIGRTCEHARLFGIQFYEVFSRGSQFRVESMMLRLAKPLNYIAVSPSIQQRARMRAPESLPLIMEPQSAFYTDPLIVLDFQSLYPSIIIAYNYCFSTCLGRVEHIGHYEPYEFGATTLKIKKDTVKKLLGKINFAPCGVAFVKPEIRMGILPRMLTEILNTRIMVKESMKLHGNKNHTLQRILHSQQLGLKLIANVTYGYTAANFSGRMPCIEIGDSVVSKGRETLEQAIKIIESTPKWGAEVVYGDTDSLFILLRGKTRKDAFAIGAEIANTITAANPPPIKLKFEKVLQPSILQTKKRYCGYMYESPDQKEPEYLAKGIETVRRDGCPAVAKILEKTLKILFDTKDLSLVKLYVTRQFDKILRKKISLQDLTFAKEFRGLHGYKTSACVPALELTRRLMRKDPREIPRTGERVRYIIVAGAPNQPLIQCVRTPIEVISDEGLTPNSIYYITKVIIPPLNRCLNLINIDTNAWYREMIHRETPDKVVTLCMNNQKQTIRQFFSTVVCAACGNQTQRDICINCVAKPSQTVTILHEKLRWLERTHHELTMMCQCCTGYLDEPKCESLDCPVLYRLMEARRDLVQIPYLHDIINN
ncbi:DNA polymerase zeta catalytic subunit, partial [Eufriesea mexicana]